MCRTLPRNHTELVDHQLSRIVAEEPESAPEVVVVVHVEQDVP